MSYLDKMTVKELREIAARMDVYLQSRVKKETIIFLIEARLENLHSEALEMNTPEKEEFKYTLYSETGEKIADFYGAEAQVLSSHYQRVLRFNPTMRRHKSGPKKGYVILTPKQYRRVNKKTKKVAKKVGMY